MPGMSCSWLFDDPIESAKAKQIVPLRHAATYVIVLPKKVSAAARGQTLVGAALLPIICSRRRHLRARKIWMSYTGKWVMTD